ncbi:hypothetical protein NKDENANG_02118 [Candidatus Entotheonellaceae bacterium PAL068K]
MQRHLEQLVVLTLALALVFAFGAVTPGAEAAQNPCNPTGLTSRGTRGSMQW